MEPVARNRSKETRSFSPDRKFIKSRPLKPTYEPAKSNSNALHKLVFITMRSGIFLILA